MSSWPTIQTSRLLLPPPFIPKAIAFAWVFAPLPFHLGPTLRLFTSCAVRQTPSSARSRVTSSMIYARRPRHLRLSTRSIACALEVAWTTAPRSSSTVQLQSNRTGTNTTDTPSSIRLTSRWRSLYIRPQFVCRPSSADFTPESSTSCNQHFVTRHLVLMRQAAAMHVV